MRCKIRDSFVNGSKARIAGLVLALLAAATTAHADDPPMFAVYKLSVPDYLQYHWIEDLDNDGRKDILVVHRKGLPPDETRWVSIFWQGADGSFATAADQSWELDKEAVVMDIGDVAGDPKKEICYVTPADVRYHELEGRLFGVEPKVLFETKGLAVFPSKTRVPLINFIRDWNDSGMDDVGIFAFEGLVIHSARQPGQYNSKNLLHIDLETSMGQSYSPRGNDDRTKGLHASYDFPNLTLLDFNNDGTKDLIANTDEKISVHLRGADGMFSPDADWDFEFDVLTQEEKIEGFAEVDTDVEELNDDGYADAIVTKQTSKGLTNFRGVVNMYWGKPGGYSDTPDQVIISEGTASAGTMFWDVNGDGRKDLVLPSVKISVAAIIRFLITRSIKVYFNLYLLGEDGRFSDRPDFTKEIKFKIDFSGESDDQATDLEGDYNGDKRTDFVFATEEDELSIFLGVDEKDRLFSKKAKAKVKADAYGELSSHDLNGDGFSDMVIYYPQSKERKGVLEVLVNLGRLE
ncbi:MAG: VCBS repeat-containing protein [Candidatus Latescibacterota bacterium]|jgi:hypothetical protein